MQQLQEAHFQVVAERFAVKMRAHRFGLLLSIFSVPRWVPRLPVVGVAADVLQGPFRWIKSLSAFQTIREDRH